MSISPRLGLPFLQSAQAQKHVTVNEALVLLDGVTCLTLLAVDTSVPPGLASDGDAYGVPTGATGAWAGQGGDVALYSNGGWVFISPQRGWRAWVVDRNFRAIFDGSVWVEGAVALSQNNAATVQEVIEIDHNIGAGSSGLIPAAIPAHSMVIGVTGRVTGAITGTLSDWKLGVAGADNRYGSGLGLVLGSWVRGLTSSPQTYYSETDLLMTGTGGDFAAGQIRVAIHVMRLNIPGV